MRPAIALFLASALWNVGACRRSGPRAEPEPAVDEISGLYEVGIEPRGFRFCDVQHDAGLWRPIEFPAGHARPATPGLATGLNAAMYYVRVRGGLAPRVPGGTGQPRAVLVREVLEIRAAGRGDCGWSPPRSAHFHPRTAT
jgi:hypothetical protein